MPAADVPDGEAGERTMLDPLESLPGYELIGPLASGGMAEVLLAWQTGPGGFRRRVVLKRVHRHLLSEQEFVDMFLNEARIAAGLAHRNIAHVHEIVQTRAGDHVIVMEYIRGTSVHRLLRALRKRDARLPLSFAVAVVAEICEAIDYAYNSTGPEGEALHIVHRDVSPSNIMVSVDGQVKLLDFGIAKITANAAVTKVGSVKGKYQYMAPEQLRGELVDVRADLFSLGAVLYEMTTGVRPFRGKNEAEQIAALLVDEVRPPRQIVEDYPEDLERIVMQLLQRDRFQRFQSARELADELERCASIHEWTMKSVSLGTFVKSVMGPEIVEPSGPILPSPFSSSRSLPAASGSRAVASAPPSSPPSSGDAQLRPSPEPEIPVVVVTESPAARAWLAPAIVAVALLLATVAFWLVLYPALTN